MSSLRHSLARLRPHRPLVGWCLAAAGLALVVYSTLFGAFFTEPTGRGASTYEIGLVQSRECYLGRGGMTCHGVGQRAFRGSSSYEALRWATLGSLSVLILAIAGWVTNRISPNGGARFPEPTAGRAVVLFAEIFAVSLPLAFLKPAGWSLASGYFTFELGALMVIGGAVLRILGASQPELGADGDAPQPAQTEPPPQPVPTEETPASTSPASALVAEQNAPPAPACRRCGKSTVYRPMHGRYHCPACGLYGPPVAPSPEDG